MTSTCSDSADQGRGEWPHRHVIGIIGRIQKNESIIRAPFAPCLGATIARDDRAIITLFEHDHGNITIFA